MNHRTKTVLRLTSGILLLTFLSTITVAAQDDIAVRPELLNRLSWSAIFAGTLVALIIGLVLNMLGVAAGLTSINPQYGTDSADAKEVGMGAAIWYNVSALIALFVGGWMAARFAGIPSGGDGLLHGFMTWCLTTLVTMFLLTTSIGRLLNGTGTLISQGLSLVGDAAQATAGAASSVVQGTASAVGTSAQVLASGASSTVQALGSAANTVTHEAIDRTPSVQGALENQDITYNDIKMQARQILREAGSSPEKLESQAQAAQDDVRQAAQALREDPRHWDDILETTLRRLFRRAEYVANDFDRQSVVSVLTAETDMSEEEVRQTVNDWEQRYEEAQTKLREARDQARQEAEQRAHDMEARAHALYDEARKKAHELEAEAEQRMTQMRLEAEKAARTSAQAATDALAKLAGAVAAALIIGAIAASLGGLLGTPNELPTAEIDLETSIPAEVQDFYIF